jgi:hypothetical protein
MWLVEKNKKELLAFKNFETEITHLTKQFMESDHCHEIRSQLKYLENDRNKFLLAEEER